MPQLRSSVKRYFAFSTDILRRHLDGMAARRHHMYMAAKKKPDKKVSIRIPADDHRRISMLAIVEQKSLQALTLGLLRDWAYGRTLARRKAIA